MPIKPDHESFTLLLPKELRSIAEEKWTMPAKFNYSLIIRQAILDYYKKNGWME